MSKKEKLKFVVESDELKRAKKWMKEQKEKYGDKVGTVGDRFSYKFTPTGLGVIVSIMDSLTGESKLLTDFTHW